jgi:hypothetical protein
LLALDVYIFDFFFLVILFFFSVIHMYTYHLRYMTLVGFHKFGYIKVFCSKYFLINIESSSLTHIWKHIS